MLPNPLFCPHCDAYVGRRAACACARGWERPPVATAAAAALTLDQPILGPLLCAPGASPLLVVPVAGEGGGLLALDPVSGAQRWRRELGAAVIAGAGLAPDGSTLVVGDVNGRLHGLRLADGADAWPAPLQLDGAIEAAPLLPLQRSNHLATVATRHGQVAQVDWRTGGMVGAHYAAEPGAMRFAASPVAWGQSALLAGLSTRRNGGGALYLLEAAGLREIAATPAGLYTAPLLLPGTQTVVVGGADGDLLALDLRQGIELWRAPLGKSVRAAPALVGDALYAGCGERRLYAVDARTGALRWQLEWDHSINSPPSVNHGLLLFADSAGRVVALDLEAAQPRKPPPELWRFDCSAHRLAAAVGMPSAAVLGGFVWVGEKVWCGAANGCLYRLPAHGGNLHWALARAKAHGRWLDAAALLVALDARAGEREAAVLLDTQGEHARAAAIYEALGEPSRAAQALERAGAQERRPWYLYRAANLWMQLSQPVKAQACHVQAARMGNRPLLSVEVMSVSAFKLGERGRLCLAVRNEMEARARRIRVRIASSDWAPAAPVEFLELLHGLPLECVLPIEPRNAGDEIELTLLIDACDDLGNDLPTLRWTQVVRVAGRDMPAIHYQIERLFTGPATVLDENAVLINRGRPLHDPAPGAPEP